MDQPMAPRGTYSAIRVAPDGIIFKFYQIQKSNDKIYQFSVIIKKTLLTVPK